jgi:nucleoside-diphosphate-sugar epimerase
MTKKRIFITGASGCIGHYVAEQLIRETDHELFLLVRNPDKLQLDTQARPGIHLLHASMQEIEQFADLLKTIDLGILIATAWGAEGESYTVNLEKTHKLLSLFDPERIEQVLYFSTASILGNDNQLLPEAEKYGSEYIRSKYLCYVKLGELAIAPKITALFPTLVFGGDRTKPYSHMSAGLPRIVGQAGLIRWFSADASCHFIHSRDIAQVVCHLLKHPVYNDSNFEKDAQGVTKIILGNPGFTLTSAADELGKFTRKPSLFRIPLTLWMANIFIKIFQVQIDAWDRFCIDYRHFSYPHPVSPATFGLKGYYPNLTDIFAAYSTPVE